MNRYKKQLALINSENVNISSEGDGKVFFKLVFIIICIILILLFCFDLFAGIIIDNMSDETQLKIESLFKNENIGLKYPKYKNEIEKLNYIKKQIIQKDKSLQNKSSFPIFILKEKKINAMINPGGTIYFTTGLLDKNLSGQELAFVLAHELGHYSHKDHLKSISRQIFLICLYSFTGQNNYLNSIVKGITETNSLYHSRNQEEKADLYAGEMLIKLYGTNEGGIKFLKMLKENENTPDFLYYFSTHPPLEKRLSILEKQN